MSYYQKNREKLRDKYHNQGGKEKAKKYYQNNKDIIKEKQESDTKIYLKNKES